jgi:hypothetical protein
MGAGPITFVYSNWTVLFPELAGVTQPQAQLYFNLAQDLCDNTACSPVCNVQTLTDLLNLATAHLAKLFSQQTEGVPTTSGTEGPSTGVVGRVSNAAEGTVSVAVVMPEQRQNAAWWQQTQYGALWWQISLQFQFGGMMMPGRNLRPPGGPWGQIWNGGFVGGPGCCGPGGLPGWPWNGGGCR